MDSEYGVQWPMLLPQCYPNDKTVHHRFQHWCERAGLREMLKDLATTRRDEGTVDERERCIDATVAAANGGGNAVDLTKRGKG